MLIEYLITEDLMMPGNEEVYHRVPVLPGLTAGFGRWNMAMKKDK